MHSSKTLGYLAYPVLLFSLITSSLIAVPQARAQSGTDATTPQSNGPAPQSTQEPQLQQPPPASTSRPTEQDRVRLAREAQERVRARRRQRIQAVIQDTYSHRYEASLGYAYLRLRPGHSLQHVTETGWNIQFTDFIRPRLGLTGDFRGYYATAYTGNNIYSIFKPSISNYSVLGGPEYRFVERKSYAVSGQVLAGVTRNLFDGNSQGFPGTLLGLYPNQWRFAAGAGAPIDLNVSPALAVRVTPTYYLTTFGGDAQHNLGFTAGVMYRFGRR